MSAVGRLVGAVKISALRRADAFWRRHLRIAEPAPRRSVGALKGRVAEIEEALVACRARASADRPRKGSVR